MGYIYMLTSPSGKSYIGQTIRPIEKRLEEHQQKSSRCVLIYKAIQKYGWDKIVKEWYECPDDDLNKHEELMVEVLGTLTPDGYNLREGGGSRGKHSEESKQKNREAHVGKTTSDETKQKQREASLGKTHSDETKQKQRESKIGKPRSEETKQKMRKPKSEEHNIKNREAHLGEKNSNSKTVYQFNLDGTFIRSFGSGGEAGRHLKKYGANISACAHGDSKTAYGFRWSYDQPSG
jgi:group I intron endonuclease